jgi:L-malate glycosyltransferase
MKFSAIVITYNEEKHIATCLDRLLKVSDDVIVIDSFSTDGTQEICLQKKINFIQNQFINYSKQRMVGVQFAKYDYVLFVDADEYLSEELIQSLINVSPSLNEFDGYRMNRKNLYCGKWIRFGGWYPDRKTRLCHKERIYWMDSYVHEKLFIPHNARLKKLNGDLIHDNINSIDDHKKKVDRYTSIAAQELFDKKIKPNWFQLVIKPPAKWIETYLIRLGFLDGYYGWVIANLAARYQYLKYHKLKQLFGLKRVGHAAKILHLSSEMTWRGGEQQMAYLIEELEKQRKIQQFVFVKKNSAFAKYCKTQGLSFVSVGLRGEWDIAAALEIKRFCRSQNIAVVHAHSSHAHGLAVLSAQLGNACPIIVSRRVDFSVSKNFLSGIKYNTPAIKKFICVSQLAYDILVSSLRSADKCIVIHDGIDLNRFSKKNSANVLREEFNIRDEIKIIGNIAALEIQKDYFTFVETVKILKEKKMPFKFFIVGAGSQQKAIEEKIQAYDLGDSVILTGFRSDIENILSSLDILLFTSEMEGLGSTVLDAMAAKIPVVATRAGGIPEIIRNGENGLLSDVKDASSLAENVQLLLQNESLKNKIIQQAYEDVQHFSKEKMASETLRVYEEAVYSSR